MKVEAVSKKVSAMGVHELYQVPVEELGMIINIDYRRDDRNCVVRIGIIVPGEPAIVYENGRKMHATMGKIKSPLIKRILDEALPDHVRAAIPELRRKKMEMKYNSLDQALKDVSVNSEIVSWSGRKDTEKVSFESPLVKAVQNYAASRVSGDK